jgi:hypothetical protein
MGGDEASIAKALASAHEPTQDGKRKRATIHEAIALKNDSSHPTTACL